MIVMSAMAAPPRPSCSTAASPADIWRWRARDIGHGQGRGAAQEIDMLNESALPRDN